MRYAPLLAELTSTITIAQASAAAVFLLMTVAGAFP
jgi:hypothetical protein